MSNEKRAIEEAEELGRRLSQSASAFRMGAFGELLIALPLEEARRIADLLDTLPRPLLFKRGDRVLVLRAVVTDGDDDFTASRSGSGLVVRVDPTDRTPYLVSLDDDSDLESEFWFAADRVTALPAEKETSND